jgi:hypothetical protein
MVSEKRPGVAVKGRQRALWTLSVLLVMGLILQGGCSTSKAALPERSARSLDLQGSTPTSIAQAAETRPDGAIRVTTPPAGASDQNLAFAPDGTADDLF